MLQVKEYKLNWWGRAAELYRIRRKKLTKKLVGKTERTKERGRQLGWRV